MSLCLSNKDRHTLEYKLKVLYSLMFTILFSTVSKNLSEINRIKQRQSRAWLLYRAFGKFTLDNMKLWNKTNVKIFDFLENSRTSNLLNKI